ncbi:DUF4817 domain-containing protein [Trichonephila clavipes]|nr:DUF4817 domain-containing protein [Trichonephila clavipes]
MGSEISRQIWDGIGKWEIVHFNDPGQVNGTKLLNYYIVIGPGQFGLAIHQNDCQARRRFVEWAQNEIVVVPDFHKRILFSDEAHFWLNGYVNKQNCRIWSEANPQVYVETPLHPEKLTVWCALWSGAVVPTRWGATCHTARATIDLLKDTFGDRLISRFRPVNWPPRSCDLTPLDYFLWSYVKPLVYADKSQTLDHLEDNIRRVIADIRPQMLEKVIENRTSRLDYIRASHGSHMPEIIFNMMSPNAVYKLGKEVESILRSHNYIGNHGGKRNPKEIRDTNISDGYSCHLVHFRINDRVVNRASERSMFLQVQMHPSERLMIQVPPHCISFPMQTNSNTSISVDLVVDELDNHQLGVHIAIHVHRTLSMSEMRKPPVC